MGWLIGPLATVLLTALIGGAAFLSVIVTRHPTGQALERLDNNTATPEDMRTIQNANQESVRNAQILRAGGSLIGSRGPIPNIGGGAAGRIVGGQGGALGGAGVSGTPTGAESALGGVVNRAIGSLATQASRPSQTRDNVATTGTPSQPPQSGPARQPVDFGVIDRLGQESRGLRPGGGAPETGGSLGGPAGTSPSVVGGPGYREPAASTTPGAQQPFPGGPMLPPPGGGMTTPYGPTGGPYPPQQPCGGAGAGDCPPGQHREQPGGPCH